MRCLTLLLLLGPLLLPVPARAGLDGRSEAPVLQLQLPELGPDSPHPASPVLRKPIDVFSRSNGGLPSTIAPSASLEDEQRARQYEAQRDAARKNPQLCLPKKKEQPSKPVDKAITGGGFSWSTAGGFGFFLEGGGEQPQLIQRFFEYSQRLLGACPAGSTDPGCASLARDVCE